MSDITPEILPRLTAYRLPGLDLGGQFVYPAYAGGSILNLPATICQALGVEPLGGLPLSPGLVVDLPADIRRVILVLVDALALHRLQRWMSDGTAPVWQQLAQGGMLSALTSVVPSTTSTALTTLWTGKSPSEHGVVGYELWL